MRRHSRPASKFERIKHLVPHRVSSGDYHEEIIRVTLRNFLPKRFSVKRGFIYSDDDRYSKQLDILIVDENKPSAYIFQEGDFAIVRPASVVAVIEVKSSLDAPRFSQAVRNIKSAKELYDAHEGSKIMTAIFGYQGTQPQQINLHKWFTSAAAKEIESSQHLAPDLIFFFAYETVLVHYNPETKFIGDGDYYHAFVTSKEVGKGGDNQGSGWQLKVLLAHLIDRCQKNDNSGPFIALSSGQLSDANVLLKSANFLITSDAFKFGEGALNYSSKPTK